MTQPLYQENPYIAAFTAQVHTCEASGEGEFLVTLSDTAFYPGGGGQPCDTGTLDGHHVTEAFQTVEDGPVFHRVLSDQPLCGEVRGEIDWARRFDFMQQHSGQHLLSYAVYALIDGYSLGLHIGDSDGYVDIQTPRKALTPEEIAWLENCTDELITRDIPVHQWLPTPEEIKELPLRKPPFTHERLRIVHMGPECVACCGTHLSSTGQARLVRVLGQVQSHGNLRLFFVSGERAVRYARACTAQAEAAAAALSCNVAELAEMVVRLRDGQKAQAHELAVAKKELALHHLEALQPEDVNGQRLLVAELPGLEPKQQQEAVSALLKKGCDAVCLATQGEKGVFVVLGSAGGLHAGNVFRRLTAMLGGKGGGRADFAQGLCARFDVGAVKALLETETRQE